MKVDNINLFSNDKLQQVIEQRFGQKVELDTLSDDALGLFAQSIEESISTFERSHAYNQNSYNARYLENKILLDYILKEQETRLKVNRVQGKEVELTDPNKPGVKTTVNTDQVDVNVDKQTKQVSIKPKDLSKKNPTMNNLKPGQQVSMEDLDDEARNFIDYIQDQGYKIISQGAGPKGISIEYQDRDGGVHQVDFKDGKMKNESEGDLEDVVAPEFKKLVHDMQQGMSKEDLEKKYPNSKKDIDQLAKDLATVAETIRLAVTGQIGEATVRLGGRESAALRLLVGPENFVMARRALEMAKSGQSVPASLMKGFMPVIDKLDTFIKGGAGAMQRFKSLERIVGKESYEAKLKKLLENEMETSEILLASQDIVDQITDMYEKIAEIKSSAVLELVDRMSNEMGQEKADAFSGQINPTLEALEQALSTARKGAQDSVAVVKGESPEPMVGDSDSDIDTDFDADADIEGDSDIEGGDDFGASDPATGGDEPAGRAER